jgi:hypothetical protein
MSEPKAVFMTVDRVAEVTGLTRGTIYQVGAVAGLGSPAHFTYAHGIVVYTLAGLCQIAEALQAEHATAAKALAYELGLARQRAASAAGVTTPDDEEARKLAARWDVRVEVSISRIEEAAA